LEPDSGNGGGGGGGLGVAYALLAYGAWGVLPAYWKALDLVPAAEILAHRVAWSVVFAALLVALSGRWREVRDAAASARGLGVLAATAALIAVNWGIFLYAVQTGQIVATSLGYFLNPLVSTALGMVVLRERLGAREFVSLGLGGVGVLSLAAATGVPWIALSLAVSFALDGLLRKLAPVASLPALAVETALLAPAAVGYIALLEVEGRGAFGHPPEPAALHVALLAGAGVATALPLLWFASAARRLRLATLGQLQYIAPSLALLLAVAVYGEPFTRVHAVAFGCIWAGLALWSLGAARDARDARVTSP